MKKLFAFLLGAMWLTANGAEPENYYSSCEGTTGQALLKKLAAVVGPHTNVGYDGLWAVYKTSDVRADGTLWDMYSTKAWPQNFSKCGNYKLVGDCVNREHSFPKSWWGGGKQTQYSDAYHLYPTDGKVNGQRSNYAFGECANGKTLASNGSVRPLGRLGTSTFPGFSGTVFEPDDEYKGDFARSYFYLAAAYNSNIGRWTSGNGGDMLAGNSYPVFKTWALNLLLKWHRQDPVSQKELDRNEAVSKHQKNRNPFIDHPEMVEYVWGDKQGIAWHYGAGNEPQIVTPSPSTLIDLGTTAVNVTRSRTVSVKGADLTENVSVSVSGAGFSVTPSSLAASAVNSAEGTSVTVSYRASEATTASGVLTLRSGDLTTVCTVVAAAVDGLPAGPATEISDESFVATWSCIDEPSATYTLDVRRNGTSIEGYPRQVRAGDERALVSGLEPETAYTYTVASSALTSLPVEVTTAEPVPSVDFLYDGELEFVALPGVPSATAEILVLIENIPGDVTISVTAPFQVSTDKQAWGTSVILAPGEERFYMRMLGQTPGDYTTSVTATATGYFNDNLDVDGTVSTTAATFHEDFEPQGANTYNDKTYVGSACSWKTNALFAGDGDQTYPHEGKQAARTPTSKYDAGYFIMLESKRNGMGTLSFWARLWAKETASSEFEVFVSDDEGSTWESVGSVNVVSTVSGSTGANVYAEYTLPINRKGSLRLKLQQKEKGHRTLIDDLRITDYIGQDGIEAANMAEYHSWDAFCRNGLMILESDGTQADHATVYSIDGTECYSSLLPAGETGLQLTPGLYIVVVRDFARRVLVK